MNLDSHAREFYILDIATLPVTAPTAWAASFDDEVTWHPGASVTGHSDSGAVVVNVVGWLIAGPAYDQALSANPAGTVTLAAGVEVVRPMIRLVDNPEVPIRSAPWIFVTS